MKKSGGIQPGVLDNTAVPARRRSLGRHALKLILQLAVMGGLCVLLLRLVDVPALLAALARADLRLLPLAAVFLTGGIAVRAVRLRVLTGSRWGFSTVFHAHNVGMAVNNLLPLRAGEVIMALLLGRVTGLGASAALSIIAVDRILDIVMLILLYAGIVLLTPEILGTAKYANSLLIVVVVAVLAAMWLVQLYREQLRGLMARALAFLPQPRRTRWLQRGEGVLDGLAVLRNYRIMFMAVLLSPLTWLLSILACHLVLTEFWPEAPLATSALAVCLSALSIAIVTVPAGVGVMHASLFFSVTLFGMVKEDALLFAIVYHALIVLVSTVLGAIGLRPAGLTFRELLARLRP